MYIYSHHFSLLSKIYWHVVQSVNDLYCECYAVVQFDNTNNTNAFYEYVSVLFAISYKSIRNLWGKAAPSVLFRARDKEASFMRIVSTYL